MPLRASCGMEKQRILITVKTYPTLSRNELVPVGRIDTADNWRERRRIVSKTARVYDRLDELIAGAKANHVALAVFPHPSPLPESAAAGPTGAQQWRSRLPRDKTHPCAGSTSPGRVAPSSTT
jgi:hypothetical protein